MDLRAAGPAWLFCPADRPERYQKAAAAADVVILDLEDGCAAADRPAARTALVEVQLDPARTVVRASSALTTPRISRSCARPATSRGCRPLI